MSWLTQVKRGATDFSLSHGHHSGQGLLSHAIETLESWGASYLAARVNTQYGDKVKFRGREITYAAGVAVKLGCVVADLLGHGEGVVSHLNTVSTAVVGTHFAVMGAKDGIEARKGEAGATALKTALAGDRTALGAIPPAPEPNKWLDRSELKRVAAMHG